SALRPGGRLQRVPPERRRKEGSPQGPNPEQWLCPLWPKPKWIGRKGRNQPPSTRENGYAQIHQHHRRPRASALLQAEETPAVRAEIKRCSARANGYAQIHQPHRRSRARRIAAPGAPTEPGRLEDVIRISIEELTPAADTFIALSHCRSCKPALHDATLATCVSDQGPMPLPSVFRKRVC
ncbi:MAG: hypothetical protein K0R45_2380, partial [Pseudomonas sp.]|nr:hypothetical protein [Pseudomonas sp.]